MASSTLDPFGEPIDTPPAARQPRPAEHDSTDDDESGSESESQPAPAKPVAAAKKRPAATKTNIMRRNPSVGHKSPRSHYATKTETKAVVKPLAQKTPRSGAKSAAGAAVIVTATKRATGGKTLPAHLAAKARKSLPGTLVTKSQKKSGPVSACGEPTRRAHRFHPGTVSLRRIRKLQKTTNNLIPRAIMGRVIRSVAGDESSGDEAFRFTRGALEKVQSACESHATMFVRVCQRYAVLNGRKSPSPKDSRATQIHRAPGAPIGCM